MTLFCHDFLELVIVSAFEKGEALPLFFVNLKKLRVEKKMILESI